MSDAQLVIVGLSGGVDSAIAAYLLLEQGYRVEALFMKNWEEDDREGYCAAAQDLADAQTVATQLKIRLHTVNFAAEYWEQVFVKFLAEYQALRTPNPDVLCNREIKFAVFLEHAKNLGAQKIATGHYARVQQNLQHNSLYSLCLSADLDKDQTYFLHLLNQTQLSQTLFPLCDLTKLQVRQFARKLKLANAEKKDSTGICFIGERRFRNFLSRYLPQTPGPIETADGQQIGEHLGLAYYTLGQRKGLGVGGIAGKNEAPWYVARKDHQRNALIVVQNSMHPLLLTNKLLTYTSHWIAGSAPDSIQFCCHARLRHRQSLQACEIFFQDQKDCCVQFETPQRAATPGQSIVFYHGDECLGGAVIKQTWFSN